MPSLYFFIDFSPFLLLIALIVFLLIKRPDTILSKKFRNLLFFVGLILVPVENLFFYPLAAVSKYLDYLILLNDLVVYFIIPSLIATEILSRERSRKNAVFFILFLLFEVYAFLSNLPFGRHPPSEPAIKLEISRITIILGALVKYLTAVGIPALLCYFCTRTGNALLRILLILVIPVLLILVYNGLWYLTGGVI